jgi:uncharacterized protein YuzE
MLSTMASKKEKGLKGISARIVYDEETGSLYIYLPEAVHTMNGAVQVAKSKELNTSVIADYTKEGKLMGLEILGVHL